jgi:hypothetical protein
MTLNRPGFLGGSRTGVNRETRDEGVSTRGEGRGSGQKSAGHASLPARAVGEELGSVRLLTIAARAPFRSVATGRPGLAPGEVRRASTTRGRTPVSRIGTLLLTWRSNSATSDQLPPNTHRSVCVHGDLAPPASSEVAQSSATRLTPRRATQVLQVEHATAEKPWPWLTRPQLARRPRAGMATRAVGPRGHCCTRSSSGTGGSPAASV